MSRPLRGPYRVVFCDVGETVVQFNPGFTEILVAETGALGTAVAAADARRIANQEWDLASNDPQWRGASAEAERSQDFWMHLYETMGLRLGVAEARALAERLYGRFTGFDSYGAVDGARESLARLRHAGLTVVAASNWEPWLEGLLDHLDMRDLFDAMAVSGLMGVEKPDRAFFHRALEIAAVTPDEAVHIGDSFVADVEGAWGAGLDAIWINRRDNPPCVCPTAASIQEAADMVLAVASADGRA